jgi:hypothetical protein
MPMSYVDQNLLAGETVLFRTKYHWTSNRNSFVLAILACGLGVSFLGAWWYTPIDQRTYTALPGSILLGAGILIGIYAQVTLGQTEFAVTNQRLLCRTPLRSFDLFLYQIQQVSFRKIPLTDYGTILVRSSGAVEGFTNVLNVEKFAATIEQQVALLHQHSAAGS